MANISNILWISKKYLSGVSIFLFIIFIVRLSATFLRLNQLMQVLLNSFVYFSIV